MSGGLRVAGLFAGIGGIEAGLRAAGHHAVALNELDPHASTVLRHHFPDVPVTADVRDVVRLPQIDLLAAGFPCTNISQAGRKEGIGGAQSGLVEEVFRLVRSAQPRPEWVLLENVSYLLKLQRGMGLRRLVTELEALGYRWAYRVVDARAFGLPQRRQRVVFLASLSQDPREVIFADDACNTVNDAVGPAELGAAYGFYWTEGLRGLGWVRNAVPTIKGGSGLGIPSPPAVWTPEDGSVGTPHIVDAERMQGFPADWTSPCVDGGARIGDRWRQVGNAVCVDMSSWIGQRLNNPGSLVEGFWDCPLEDDRWPVAAYGGAGRAFNAPVTVMPFPAVFDVQTFLTEPLKPLSARATAGFLERAHRSRTLRFPEGFLDSLARHLERSLSSQVA